jgi:hypothetical protein
MAQPTYQTPPPFDRYQSTHQASYQAHATRNDDTPDWMTPVRHDTPGFASRAKKTMPVEHQHHMQQQSPEPERRPITDLLHIFTRETCWDCNGSGRSGAILYRCPVCGTHYLWAQIEAKAGERGPRDEWGAIRLPCVRECGKVPSTRLYKIYEPCRTCYNPHDESDVRKQRGKGYLDETRGIDELAQFIATKIARALGVSRAINLAEASTMPVPMYGQSEPTAPSAPLEHPAVRIPERFTPLVTPLSPDELKEF